MEEERRSEEERSHLWGPFQFCNEALKSFLKCLGLYTSPSNPSASSVHQVQEDAVTTRGILVGSKKRPREPHSSGKPGGHS
ncbi:hypothetical protein HID58_004199 [Brassica napus]|uniref:Elicitor peptide 4 n=1 Tax=Brassica napus TaxID=3708 RepID=A0ABQ8E5L6_BRANA|nr:hypothetical protein HID58_004199 [Brassica napus]